MQKLALCEPAKLIQQHCKEPDGRVWDRIKTVLAYDENYSHLKIAHSLLLDDATICCQIGDCSKASKLSQENWGNESKLSDEQTLELIKSLSENISLYAKDICHCLQEKY